MEAVTTRTQKDREDKERASKLSFNLLAGKGNYLTQGVSFCYLFYLTTKNLKKTHTKRTKLHSSGQIRCSAVNMRAS